MKNQSTQTNRHSVPMTTIKSSFIRAIGYNADTCTAVVQFSNERIYTYAEVNPKTFRTWLKSKSKGRYFCQKIKSHPYEHIA